MYLPRSFENLSDNTDSAFVLQPILPCNGSTNYYDMFMYIVKMEANCMQYTASSFLYYLSLKFRPLVYGQYMWVNIISIIERIHITSNKRFFSKLDILFLIMCEHIIIFYSLHHIDLYVFSNRLSPKIIFLVRKRLLHVRGKRTTKITLVIANVHPIQLTSES